MTFLKTFTVGAAIALAFIAPLANAAKPAPLPDREMLMPLVPPDHLAFAVQHVSGGHRFRGALGKYEKAGEEAITVRRFLREHSIMALRLLRQLEQRIKIGGVDQ